MALLIAICSQVGSVVSSIWTILSPSFIPALAAAPAPSAETMRLLETDATQFDTELLDIYLTEAGEVLDTIAASAKELAAHSDDRTALTVVRRGFHTLKGSGRMVGLTDLGELAYAVEKVHNRVLEEDLPTTPALIALIGVAESSFRRWVDALRSTGRVTPDADALHAALARVESEFPDGGGDPGGGMPSSPPPSPLAAVSPTDDASAGGAAASPSLAILTSCPSASRLKHNPVAKWVSSSTISTRLTRRSWEVQGRRSFPGPHPRSARKHVRRVCRLWNER